MSATRPSLSLIAATAVRSAVFLGLATTAFVASDNGRLFTGFAGGSGLYAAASADQAGEGTCAVIALPRPTTPIRVVLPAMTDSLGPMAKLLCGSAAVAADASVAGAAEAVVTADVSGG